jgi:hypothetical protein
MTYTIQNAIDRLYQAICAETSTERDKLIKDTIQDICYAIAKAKVDISKPPQSETKDNAIEQEFIQIYSTIKERT